MRRISNSNRTRAAAANPGPVNGVMGNAAAGRERDGMQLRSGQIKGPNRRLLKR